MSNGMKEKFKHRRWYLSYVRKYWPDLDNKGGRCIATADMVWECCDYYERLQWINGKGHKNMYAITFS